MPQFRHKHYWTLSHCITLLQGSQIRHDVSGWHEQMFPGLQDPYHSCNPASGNHRSASQPSSCLACYSTAAPSAKWTTAASALLLATVAARDDADGVNPCKRMRIQSSANWQIHMHAASCPLPGLWNHLLVELAATAVAGSASTSHHSYSSCCSSRREKYCRRCSRPLVLRAASVCYPCLRSRRTWSCRGCHYIISCALIPCRAGDDQRLPQYSGNYDVSFKATSSSH